MNLSLIPPSSPLRSINTQDPDYGLISKISNLDSIYVKWKSEEASTNQVVVKDDHFYYKVYKLDKYVDWLKYQIILTLGKIYIEKGIDWQLAVVDSEVNNWIYIIEKREKLHALSISDNIPLTEVFRRFNPILEELEKRLELNKIQNSLGTEFKLRLIRKCVPKFNDYALHNDSIILLDDADFFLVFVNDNEEVCSFQTGFYELGDNLLLTPSIAIKLEQGNTRQNYWTLRKIPDDTSKKYFSNLENNLLDLADKEIFQTLKWSNAITEFSKSASLKTLLTGLSSQLFVSSDLTEKYFSILSLQGDVINDFYIDSNNLDRDSLKNLLCYIKKFHKNASIILRELNNNSLDLMYDLLGRGDFYSFVSFIFLSNDLPADQIKTFHAIFGFKLIIAPILNKNNLSQIKELYYKYSIPTSPLLGINDDYFEKSVEFFSLFKTESMINREEFLNFLSSNSIYMRPFFMEDFKLNIVNGNTLIKPSKSLIKDISGYGIEEGLLFKDIITLQASNF